MQGVGMEWPLIWRGYLWVWGTGCPSGTCLHWCFLPPVEWIQDHLTSETSYSPTVKICFLLLLLYMHYHLGMPWAVYMYLCFFHPEKPRWRYSKINVVLINVFRTLGSYSSTLSTITCRLIASWIQGGYCSSRHHVLIQGTKKWGWVGRT